MAFKEGDFLEVEYSEYDASSNELIAATNNGKEGSSHANEGTLVILGSGLLKGFEQELKKMNVGEQKTFVLEPEDAYGIRDESKVRIMNIAEFRQRNIKPEEGMLINIDGSINVVRSVSSGRVVVDANSIYAGKSIKYEIKIVNQITGDKEKINALAKALDAMPESVEVADGIATLSYKAGDKSKDEAEHMVNEDAVAKSIMKYISLKEVCIKRRYPNEAKAATETEGKVA